jgi:hypothetical protein
MTILPGTFDASSPISLVCLINPRLSLKNLTADPATAIDPTRVLFFLDVFNKVELFVDPPYLPERIQVYAP